MPMPASAPVVIPRFDIAEWGSMADYYRLSVSAPTVPTMFVNIVFLMGWRPPFPILRKHSALELGFIGCFVPFQ